MCVQLFLLGLLLPLSSTLGQRTSELYTNHRGTYSYDDAVPLVRSHPFALPDTILPYIMDEAKKTHVWEKKARSKTLKHSKAATNWASMENIRNPRTASEMAVALLMRLAFPKNELPAGGIAGGEWWVQLRNSNENIGFHVDKDEGIASEEQWMKMPVLSTITYLTNTGGPTLVLDQSSNRGGNVQTPELPVSGVLVYPKKNRHVLFRGNLQHGVVGEFGAKRGSQRVTFLVNWWDQKPMSPYCMSIDDNVADKFIKSDLLKNNGIMSTMFGGNKVQNFWNLIQSEFNASISQHNAVETFVDVDHEISEDEPRRFDIQVPPTKRYNFPVPHDIDVAYNQQILQFHWDDHQVAGILRNLDLRNNMCMHLFNSVPGLKVVIFRDSKDKKRSLQFDIDVSYQIAKPYVDLEESTGTVIYAANAKGTNRDMLAFAKKLFAIRPTQHNKANFLPAVGAMLVTKTRGKRYFQMPEHYSMKPGDILNWIGKIETKKKDVLQHEVKNGKLKKKKKKRSRRRNADDL